MILKNDYYEVMQIVGTKKMKSIKSILSIY